MSPIGQGLGIFSSCARVGRVSPTASPAHIENLRLSAILSKHFGTYFVTIVTELFTAASYFDNATVRFGIADPCSIWRKSLWPTIRAFNLRC